MRRAPADYVLVPEQTPLWPSITGARREPLASQEEPRWVGSRPLVMRVVERLGDVVRVESVESPNCGQALPRYSDFRLTLHVAVAQVQAIDCEPQVAADRTMVSGPPRPDRALELRVELLRDGFVVYGNRSEPYESVAATDVNAPIHNYARFDYAALSVIARSLKGEYPRETTAVVASVPEIPAQVVVSTIDALAGTHCRRDSTILKRLGAVPRDCLFWRIRLETLP